jgi:TonB family protein
MQLSPRVLAGLLAITFIAPCAFAQTGPLEPRMVYVAMPMPTPSSNRDDLQPVSLELAVGNDGRVMDVRLLNSSGDPQFDQKLRKYYLKFRLIPALAENGTPIDSAYRFVYRKNPDLPPPSPTSAANPAVAPTTVTASAQPKEKVFDEVARINRMHCKDFLWEYDLMKEIAGSKPVYDERLLRTVQAMYVVQEKAAGDALVDLKMMFSRGVRAALDECRKLPDEKFFQGVFVPTFKAKLSP